MKTNTQQTLENSPTPKGVGSGDWLAEFDPTPEEIQSILKARKARRYQRASRGDKRSAADDAEALLMLLAWEAGEVSEGVLAKVLENGDRVALRERKMRAIALGRTLAHALRILGPANAVVSQPGPMPPQS